jgi:hypothetical protein
LWQSSFANVTVYGDSIFFSFNGFHMAFFSITFWQIFANKETVDWK